MTEVRTARAEELDALSRIPLDDGGKFAGDVRDRLEKGTTTLDWIYVASVDGEPVARVAFAFDEPPANAPMERYMFGLALDRDRASARDAALAMLRRCIPTSRNAAGSSRRPASGWPLPERSSRLVFRSLEDVGQDAFIEVLSRGPADTLDRNDRYFYELTGPVGWATVMMGFLGPGDETTWKVAFDAKGAPVGYVMLSAFDDGETGTISHIGVVPEHRGRGYINDLLGETTRDAIARGFRSILSDADVINTPMGAAFERAGHARGVRPWHVWHYRYPAP